MFWETDSEAEQFVNDFQEVTSADTYWFTDPTSTAAQKAERCSTTATPLTADADPACGKLRLHRGSDARISTPWMASVSRSGLSWRWAGRSPRRRRRAGGLFSRKKSRQRCGTASSPGRRASSISTTASAARTRHSTPCAIRTMPRNARRHRTNALIKQLAPVLNAPFDDGFVTASPSVRVMAKFYDGVHYVFAGSKENVASTATFTLPSVSGGTATVIDEGRTISITGGQFLDNFANGNAIHIYQINTGGTPTPGAPTIGSFSTDSNVIGDGITNDNTLTLTGTARRTAR